MRMHEPPPLPDLSTVSRSQLESMVLQLHSSLSTLARMTESLYELRQKLEVRVSALEAKLRGGGP
jgi:hypothetical protein